MKTRSSARLRRGFLLLEVVLALAIFGIAATAFTVAIHRMAAAADLAQSELQVTRILESALDEELSLPTLQEGKKTVSIGTSGMEVDTKTELIEDLENQDGQLLQETYRIVVTAHWFQNNAWQERSAETWRYGRLYQP
jgi:prepilin-type N-terminal cleavage/methylation domain-containing protein